MSELTSDTVLHRAPSMSIELGDGALIRVNGRQVGAANSVLSILEAFAHPIAYSKAVDALSKRIAGVEAWIDLVSTIKQLYTAGVLVDESETAPVVGKGWSAPVIHIAMLNDRKRTDRFLEAVAAVVRPDDVVVDIGTGTGVLAAAAARAGARYVYAIEASEIGSAAEDLFAANGLADRITLLPGWSPQIELPEKANVLIAEIIGNDPLEEGVMETFSDARKRFLTPDARIIPGRLRIFGLPVVIDDATSAKYIFEATTTKTWNDWYGLDFDVLPDASLNESVVFNIPPHKVRDWPELAPPILLADLDLTVSKPPLVNESSEFRVTKAGLLGGIVVYFDLDLAPGIRLSTAPAESEESCSWLVKVWTAGAGIPVEPGDGFRISYKYRVDTSATKVEIQRL